MATVIRLDTEALKFLLEHLGDEFVLELKSAVMKHALKAHIGMVTDHELKVKILELINLEIKAQVAEKPWERYPTLQEHLRQRIESAVSNEIHDSVWDTIRKIDVQAVIDESVESWAEHVKKRVYHAMQSAVVKWAEEEVERRLSLLSEEG